MTNAYGNSSAQTFALSNACGYYEAASQVVPPQACPARGGQEAKRRSSPRSPDGSQHRRQLRPVLGRCCGVAVQLCGPWHGWMRPETRLPCDRRRRATSCQSSGIVGAHETPHRCPSRTGPYHGLCGRSPACRCFAAGPRRGQRTGSSPTGAATTKGRLPPEVIQRIVRGNFGRFRTCYGAAKPGLAGTGLGEIRIGIAENV